MTLFVVTEDFFRLFLKQEGLNRKPIYHKALDLASFFAVVIVILITNCRHTDIIVER